MFVLKFFQIRIELTNNKKMSVKIGKPAPGFKATAVVNGNFEDISLEKYKGKYVVLFFYPLDFTFVCPTGMSCSKSIEKIFFFRNYFI